MGLGAIELLIEMEQKLGITVPVDETTSCDTPRQLIDLIFLRLPSTPQQTCPSRQAFYLLRKTLQAMFQVERNQVKLTTPICEIIPFENQKTHWNLLKQTLQARSWPDMSRPLWLTAMLTAIVMLTFVGAIAAIQRYAPGYSVLLTICFGAIIALCAEGIAVWLTRPFKCRIPLYSQPVASLIPFVLTSDAIRWTRENVASIVKQIIIEYLGLNEADYWEDATFIEDLGMY